MNEQDGAQSITLDGFLLRSALIVASIDGVLAFFALLKFISA